MIAAIITLYNPSVSVYENAQTISQQVDKLYLCDNSPESNADMFSGIKNSIYYFMGANLALSGAFNYVLKKTDLGWDDEDFVIFFDQDSSIKQGHISKLILEYNNLSENGYNVGSIGPLYYDRNVQIVRIPRRKIQINENSYIVPTNITSSLLCKYGILKEVDFWNEKLFLDLADWDLCWRMSEKGTSCIRTKCTVLEHALGNGERKLGPIVVSEGAPIRNYYQTRNYLILLHEKYTPKMFKLRFIYDLTIRSIERLIVLDDKKVRMKYMLAGWRDYFRKYYGEYGKG